MDTEVLTTQLRAVTGFTARMISDQDLGIILSVALNEYLQYRPGLQLTSTSTDITTVADQPNYSMPTDALWIVEVGWNPDHAGDYAGDDAIGQLYADIATQTFDPNHPSELTIIYQQFAAYRRFFAGKWKIINDEIWLIPTPGQSGDNVAVFYAKAVTLDDLSEVKDQPFFELARGHVMTRRALDLSGDSDWRAGTYQVGTGPAKQMLNAAEDVLGRARHIIANAYWAERTGPVLGVRSE